MEKLVSLEILKTYHDKAVVPLLQKLYSIEELNKEIPSLLKTTNEEVVSGNVPIYDGASGLLIKDSGFSIKSSVPSNALFTDKYKDANASVDEVNYLVGATSNIQNQITQIKDDLLHSAIQPIGNITVLSFDMKALDSTVLPSNAKSLEGVFYYGDEIPNLILSVRSQSLKTFTLRNNTSTAITTNVNTKLLLLYKT